MRIWLLVLLMIAISFSVSCEQRIFEYSGEHPELYSVAISSILNASGERVVGGWDGSINPTISIVEKDDYGRVLFSYNENDISNIIMQKFDENYVYFYPHYNFISRQGVWLRNMEPRPENWGGFSDEDIEALKEANSWNQPMSDDSEFVRARIGSRREEGIVPTYRLIEVGTLLFPDSTLNREQVINSTVFFRMDKYGRSIYFRRNTAILFQPDHSFDMEIGALELEERFNYQTELRLFMESNGWDTPFEGQLKKEDE